MGDPSTELKIVGYDLPKIEVTEAQELWLKGAYSMVRAGKRVSERALISELNDRLPPDFQADSIDRRLIRFDCHLTLLGVWHADPETDWLELADRIIRGIGNVLVKNPDKNEVRALDIAKETNISKSLISRLLEIIGMTGELWDSVHASEHGIESVRIFSHKVHLYRSYRGIEHFIRLFYKKHEPREAHQPNFLSSDRPHSSNQSRTDRMIHRIKDHRVVAVIIVVGTIVMAVLGFLGQLGGIMALFR